MYMHQTRKPQNTWNKTKTDTAKCNKLTFVIEDFNNLLFTIDRRSRQKINKGIEDLNSTISQQDLIDIYGTFHATTLEHKIFQEPMEYSPRLSIYTGPQTNLNKFKRIKIIY